MDRHCDLLYVYTGVTSTFVVVRCDPATLRTEPVITYDSELVLSIFCRWIVPTVYEVYEHRQHVGNAVYQLYSNDVTIHVTDHALCKKFICGRISLLGEMRNA
jgi:hypothetical protein